MHRAAANVTDNDPAEMNVAAPTQADATAEVNVTTGNETAGNKAAAATNKAR